MPRATAKGERHRRIIAELRSSPAVRISDLAREFHVSTETVRRDIDELSARGLVNRTYGGAAPGSPGREPGVRERHAAMVRERDRIARRAVLMVQPGDVLMVDAGSTTTRFARRLAVEGTEATVITNSLDVAQALGSAPVVRVVLCPGDYNGREQAVFGPETLDFLSRFHANRAIIGASGITADGLTDVDTGAAWVKRRMLDRSQQHALLADHSKFGLAQLEVVCPLDRLQALITDHAPDATLADALRAAAVEIIVG